MCVFETASVCEGERVSVGVCDMCLCMCVYVCVRECVCVYMNVCVRECARVCGLYT